MKIRLQADILSGNIVRVGGFHLKTKFVHLLALLGLSASLGLAQSAKSEINGVVRDSSGAVVPGAQVTLTNDATGISFRQTTTPAGVFDFPSITVGQYSLGVEMKGFKTAKRTGNTLTVGTVVAVEIVLEVGQTGETVTVESRGEQLQTTNAAVGNVVEHKAIVELPLNGRNPLTLLTLEPGVVQRSAGGAGSGVHVNGSRDRSHNVTIDGIEANESSVPNPVSNLYRLTPDNVQEYKVTTSNATAEEGRNSGASVSVATRSGTNKLHGTLFYFGRNRVFNSNEFYSNAQGTAKPDIKMNQYGLEVGGPIIKNKTFFFGSWADQKINTTQPIDQTFGVPTLYTPSALAGNYRYFRQDPNTPFSVNGTRITRNLPQLVNPQTGALQAGVRNCATNTDLNCVASYNFAADDPKKIGTDPTIAKLFSTYPTPNNYQSGDGLNTAAYIWTPPAKFRGPNFMARVDHNFNERNSFFFRALWGNYNTLQGDPLNGRPQVFPNTPPLGEVYRKTRNFAASYRRVFSPRLINETTVGLSRFLFLFTQGEANPTWPNVVPYSFANASLPFINTPRTARAITTPQLINNLTYIRGSHVVRAGINFRFYQHNDQRGQPGGVNVTPNLSFASGVRAPVGFNTPTAIDANDNTRLLGTINDIIGIPSRLSQVFLGDLRSDQYLPFLSGNSVTLWAQGQRVKQFNFYLQDEWRIRNNLTMTYGVRWEVNKAPTEAGGRVYVPNRSITGSEGPVTFQSANSWYQGNNLGAIGPRIGIAYSPNAKTVIRTGYGIAFDPLSTFQVTAVAGRVPGLTLSCSSTLGPTGATTTAGCQSVPDVRISQGFPNALAAPTQKPSSYLTLPNQVLTNAPLLTVFDQNLKMPTVHQWNLTVQRELQGGLVAEVGYIGRRGTRLFRAYDVNQINADPILDSFRIMQANNAAGCRPDGSGCPAGKLGQAVPLVANGIVTSAFVNSALTITDLATNAAGNLAGRIEQTTLNAKLRPNQQFAGITYLDSGGDSYYHSGQATVRKRFDAGLLIGFAYTFAKSIDNQSVDPVGAASGGGLSATNSRTPTDTRNWRNERAASDFDRRHSFTANGVYELPVGKGKPFFGGAPSYLNHVIGGWSLNGVSTAYTGEPFSVRSGTRTSNFSHESRADLAPGVTSLPVAQLQNAAGFVGPVLFPNASQFAIPAPGTNGLGRNIFRGPSYFNLDLGLTKKFDLTERIKMQFRAEAFNVLNHANFDTPVSANTGSPSIRSTLFGSACCATVAPPSTQSIIQTGEAARVIQFGLKVSF